jgi:hypothetical protein
MKINQGYVDLNLIRNKDIFYRNFKNNGSLNLNVNGSVTQVDFDLKSELTSEQIILTNIDFCISCGSAVDLKNFAGLSTALTNGVLLNIDGSQVFKTNGDIMLFTSESVTSSGKVEGTEVGFINGNWDLLKTFGNGVVCNLDDLYISVRDDLSTVEFFQVSASGIKLD